MISIKLGSLFVAGTVPGVDQYNHCMHPYESHIRPRNTPRRDTKRNHIQIFGSIPIAELRRCSNQRIAPRMVLGIDLLLQRSYISMFHTALQSPDGASTSLHLVAQVCRELIPSVSVVNSKQLPSVSVLGGQVTQPSPVSCFGMSCA